ncbi:MAG: alginate export family protein [Gammaproteobacteria bacterium]|nr:alginate export family protein [Gammaproteobacteria bacterium]
MKRVLLFIAASILAPLGFAQSSNSIVDAFSNGEANLSFRYRLETVEHDPSLDDATAHTVRTRLNYKTQDYDGFTMFIEFDDVSYLADDKFNNTRNGQTTYPVVADPDGGGLNQFYFDYKADGLLFRLGRQRINLDNQRFVGGVGWRQNEQTYDAFTVVYTGTKDLKVTGSYINNISRIFGPEPGNPPSDLDSAIVLLNGNYQIEGFGNITVYYYEFDIEDAAALSNTTIGARYTNTFDAGGYKIPVAVEFATQDDTGDNLNSYSADYLLVEGGINTEFGNFKLGIESLGGDVSGGSGFITPAATLHKFQGWTDRFLNTPSMGIEDTYIGYSLDYEGHMFGATYHTFESDESIAGFGSIDYGTELDLSYGRKLTKNLDLLVKYAAYSSDFTNDDTTKFWVMLTATF